MLIIRKEQMKALSESMHKQFIDRMVLHLKLVFPEQTKQVKNLHTIIREGIDKARGYNVIAGDDVERFLECMISYGTDFDILPETLWAGEILNRKDIKGSLKMDIIDSYEIFHSES